MPPSGSHLFTLWTFNNVDRGYAPNLAGFTIHSQFSTQCMFDAQVWSVEPSRRRGDSQGNEDSIAITSIDRPKLILLARAVARDFVVPAQTMRVKKRSGTALVQLLAVFESKQPTRSVKSWVHHLLFLSCRCADKVEASSW